MTVRRPAAVALFAALTAVSAATAPPTIGLLGLENLLGGILSDRNIKTDVSPVLWER